MTSTTAQKRSQVMVGDLPEDFLRVTGVGPNQVALDAQAAQYMQTQYAGFGVNSSNVAGRLSITVAQAKLAKNYGITKMDPYCRFRVGHAVFETPTAHNGAKNPRWNKTICCYLPVGVDSIYVEIFDERQFSIDDRIAWAHIPISQASLNGETHEDWYALTGRQGEDKEGMLNLIFSFSEYQAPTAPPTVVYQQPPMMMVPGPAGMMPGYYTVPPGQQVYSVVPPQQGMVPHQQGGVPPRQPYQCTEEDIQQIKDMFPNVDNEVIKSVLEANRGNKESTITALLTMQ